MKFRKVISLLTVLCMVALTACSRNTRVYNSVTGSNPNADEAAELDVDAGEELSGSLTIYYSGNGSHIKYLAEKYMGENENVTIEFYNYDNDSDAERITKLTSGQAGDIIDLSDIDIYKYSGSGLFENLYKYMNEDESFDMSDYYTNIFKAMEIDDRLLAVPYSFTYTTVRFNSSLMDLIGVDADSLETVDCYDIYDYYSRIMQVCDSGEDLKLSEWNMLDCEISAVFDPITRLNDFSNFTEFLTIDKEIDKHKIAFSSYLNDPYDDDMMLTSNQLLKCIYPSAADMNLVRFDLSNESNSLPVVVTDSNGKIPFTVTNGPYAISSLSPNKELAWDFLSYILSDLDLTSKIKRGMSVDGFCINRNTNARIYDIINTGGKDELFEMIDSFLDKLSVYSFYNDGKQSISDEINKYLYGQNDTETTKAYCSEIAEKYLGE